MKCFHSQENKKILDILYTYLIFLKLCEDVFNNIWINWLINCSLSKIDLRHKLLFYNNDFCYAVLSSSCFFSFLLYYHHYNNWQIIYADERKVLLRRMTGTLVSVDMTLCKRWFCSLITLNWLLGTTRTLRKCQPSLTREATDITSYQTSCR